MGRSKKLKYVKLEPINKTAAIPLRNLFAEVAAEIHKSHPYLFSDEYVSAHIAKIIQDTIFHARKSRENCADIIAEVVICRLCESERFEVMSPYEEAVRAIPTNYCDDFIACGDLAFKN